MVKRNRGKRGGHSRQKLSRHRERTTVNELLEEYDSGERVIIDVNSSVQDAMPHPRYQGRQGTIKDQRGDCYEVEVKDGDKTKTLVTSPAHLKKI